MYKHLSLNPRLIRCRCSISACKFLTWSTTTLMSSPKSNTSKTSSRLSTASNLGVKMHARSAGVCFSMSKLIAFGAIGVYVGGLTARRSRSVQTDGPASIRSRSASRAVRATSSSHAATRAANSACFFGRSARHCLWHSYLASQAFNLENSSGFGGG